MTAALTTTDKPPPKVIMDKGQMTLNADDQQAITAMCATNDTDLSLHLISQAVHAAGEDAPEQTANAILAMFQSLAPRDELEALLVTQMIAVHNQALHFARKVSYCETIEGANLYMTFTNRLMRTFTQQMEALNRYRGKGQQHVTVEHVHVNDGGQAVVGSVNMKGGKRRKLV